ncbi:hypothetical protein [Thermococcus sp. MV11]|uniref:hypothetical protein n=1 Tax=Thermococcus sp. MV11 TaxID=1638267 RepID=UPI00143123D7|nr:hypothetical protein [Thermococcus sp. MV11]NJE02939.1 hypothetical protein [Thermococcus sp. MV11]
MRTRRKVLSVGILIVIGILLFVPWPGRVFYEHYSYFWWGPSTPLEKVECKAGTAPFEFVRDISYESWNVSVNRSDGIETVVAERSFLSNDGYGRTYQRLVLVRKDGRLVEVRYTSSTGPSENAYREICHTLENGTRECGLVLTVYDLEGRREERFTIYYTLWDYLRKCRLKGG